MKIKKEKMQGVQGVQEVQENEKMKLDMFKSFLKYVNADTENIITEVENGEKHILIPFKPD